jgi:hypothetical protein
MSASRTRRRHRAISRAGADASDDTAEYLTGFWVLLHRTTLHQTKSHGLTAHDMVLT